MAGGIGEWPSKWLACAVSSRVLAVSSLLLAVVSADGQAAGRPAAGLPLTTCRAAHNITYEQASRAYPVRLRGVVTYYDPYQEGHPALFIADATGGIFVQSPFRPVLKIHAGSIIDVTGATDPGGFAPIIVDPRISVVKGSRPLPEPERVTLPQLLTGTEDGRWVAIEGIVHSAEVEGMHVVLTLATDDGILTATTVKEDGANYARLVDARVSIRGVATPLNDSKRRMVGARLLFPGLETVLVEEPAPGDPFALPLRAVSGLWQYSPVAPSRHRIRVQGRVTLSWPGRLLCILDGKDGLCMQTADPTQFGEGRLIDVVGFPARDNYQPTLSSAAMRPAGNSVAIQPKRISAEDALGGGYDGELVQIAGRLIDRSLVMTDSALLLASGQLLFPAVLPAASVQQNRQLGSAWTDGSKVLVTGVLFGRVDRRQITRREGISQLESFQILLRSPLDVTVIETPSWWTSRHTLVVLGLLAVLTLAVLGWVAILRRRVEEQTVVIRRSEEKFRHLAEHDALTGLAVRAVLQERLDRAIEEARRKHTSLALLMMDLDGFKQVNDTMGHGAGDEVLRVVGKRIQASVRETDTVARFGGDEFTVLLPGVHGMEEARKIAAQVVSSVSDTIFISGQETSVSISVGVASYPDNGEDAATLRQNADIALYRAKAMGRNRYQLFSPDMARQPRTNMTLPPVVPSPPLIGKS